MCGSKRPKPRSGELEDISIFPLVGAKSRIFFVTRQSESCIVPHLGPLSTLMVPPKFSAHGLEAAGRIGLTIMTDIETARHLFLNEGLAFPTIPIDPHWAEVRSMMSGSIPLQPIDKWPYLLHDYLHEVEGSHVDNYAVLCHAGHGVNSHAIHYYLVHGALHMFLQLCLGWYLYGPRCDRTGNWKVLSNCGPNRRALPNHWPSMGWRKVDAGWDWISAKSYWIPPGKARKTKVSVGPSSPLKVLSATALAWLRSGTTRTENPS